MPAVGSKRRRSPECATTGEMRRFRPFACRGSNESSRTHTGHRLPPRPYRETSNGGCGICELRLNLPSTQPNKEQGSRLRPGTWTECGNEAERKNSADEGPRDGRRHSFDEMRARIDALETELAAARERETTTAEVLDIINSSPGNLLPVFDTILEMALRLCEASFGGLQTYDGDHFRLVTHRGDCRYDEVTAPIFSTRIRQARGGWCTACRCCKSSPGG